MGFLSDLIGGKQKTVPTSSSESSAFQRSKSSSLSTGSSESFGESGSLARSIQEVFGGETYARLFGRASNAADKAAELVPSIRESTGQLFSSGSRFLESLTGELETEGRLNERGFEDEQIDLLRSDLGRFYEEEIDPQITGRGVAAGQLGGSRGEVARGIASRGLADEFVRGSTAIRLAGQDRRDRLATTVDELRGTRAGQGIAGAAGVYGLAEAGLGLELAPYRELAAILGDRTVTTRSRSESGSTSGSVSSQLAQAFAESIGESSSKSEGKTVTRGPGLLDVFNTISKFG